MRHKPVSSALFILLASFLGCTHSQPGLTDFEEPGGTLVNGGAQLTYNTGNDYYPTWSADSRSIVHVFSEPGYRRGSRCIGILPIDGGRRLARFCDERAGHSDSSDVFAGLGLSENGALLFVQGTGHPALYSPAKTALWVADTANIYLKRKILDLPATFGVTGINWLSEMAFTGPDTFIGQGSQFTIASYPITTRVDTVFEPRALIRGSTLEGSSQVTMIAGSERAAHWTLADPNTILFVRGALVQLNPQDILHLTEESSIWSLPVAGGVATLVATVPDNRPIRSITCNGGHCLVLSNVLYIFDATNHTFAPFPGRNANPTDIAAMNMLSLSPSGNAFAYRSGGNIFREYWGF